MYKFYLFYNQITCSVGCNSIDKESLIPIAHTIDTISVNNVQEISVIIDRMPFLKHLILYQPIDDAAIKQFADNCVWIDSLTLQQKMNCTGSFLDKMVRPYTFPIVNISIVDYVSYL